MLYVLSLRILKVEKIYATLLYKVCQYKLYIFMPFLTVLLFCQNVRYWQGSTS